MISLSAVEEKVAKLINLDQHYQIDYISTNIADRKKR